MNVEAAALEPVHFCIYALANQDHFNQIEPSHATRPFLSKFYEKCESCVLSANESQRMVLLVAPPTLLWFPWGKENEEKILTVAKLPVFRPIFLDFAFSWTSLSRAKTNFRPFGIFCYVIAKCRKGIISRNWNLGQLFSRPTDWLATFMSPSNWNWRNSLWNFLLSHMSRNLELCLETHLFLPIYRPLRRNRS